MDVDRLRQRLTRAQLVLGPVSETVPAFAVSSPPPVGFIAFDLDLYSSTMSVRLGMVRTTSPLVRLTTALRDASLRRAAAIVSVCRGMQPLVAVSAPDVPCHCIPNWSEELAAAPEPNALRRQLELGDRFVVGYSGNLGRVHPVETMIDALHGLARHTEWRFLVIGSGANMQPLRHAVAGAGHTGWHFLSYQPREVLPVTLRSPDVHLILLDPRVECLVFPSKLYGILAAGRPCVAVAAENSELAHLVRDSEIGLTVAPGDADGLIWALERLCDDTAGRSRMGQTARALYEREYTVGVGARRWQELLASLD